MPRPDLGRERIMFRAIPGPIDAEAELESVEQGRDVARSEMVRVLVSEALTARERRRKTATRRQVAQPAPPSATVSP